MKTYPNQMCIYVDKEKLYPGSFTSISTKSLISAINELSPAGLKLYLYLCTIVPDTKWYMSAVIITEALGFSKSTYARAVKELKDKEYITKNKTGSFKFRKTPKSSKNE